VSGARNRVVTRGLRSDFVDWNIEVSAASFARGRALRA
jgi:hypothetical protein